MGWQLERFYRKVPWSPQLLRYYIGVCHLCMPRKFTDADPCKVIWINPSKIHTNYNIITPRSFGRLYGGNWDENINNNTETHMRITSIIEHFTKGKTWSETDYYNEWLDRTHNNPNKSWSGLKSEEQIKHRFNEIDNLYNKINKFGYTLQSEIISNSYEQTINQCNDAPHPLMNEVGVNIGRDGSFYFRSSGLHRLAIAKSLNLKEIPVQVRVRHPEWQMIRDEIICAKDYISLSQKAKKNITHPDLQDIIF